jgi:Electron transfer DM13
MSLLGDLGGWFLAVVYDNRFAVGALGAILVAGLLLVARRRHWAAAVRRHPVAASVAVVAGLVVLVPVGWYLVSPVFVRTELVEPPLAVAARPTVRVTPAAAGSSTPTVPPAATSPSPPSARPVAPTAPPWVPTPPRSGTFTGTDDFHFGRGTATLHETSPGEWTIRLEDFSVRNGPDLYVYLSPARNGYADGAIEVAKLKATDGSFNVRLPAGTDPAGARSVLIWCKQFSHLFAYATLES